MKLVINVRPEDDMEIFVYDNDQFFMPSYSRIYGSDYRKLSQVNIYHYLLGANGNIK